MNSLIIRRVTIVGLFILSMLLLTIGCEPAAPFKIKNGTDSTLTIYIACSATEHIRPENERVLQGEVKPHEILKPRNVAQAFSSYLIEARDTSGNIMYSKEYSGTELINMQWEITVSK